jgi:hypothetical protein
MGCGLSPSMVGRKPDYAKRFVVAARESPHTLRVKARRSLRRGLVALGG